jgi:hypothetical protein
VEHSSPEPSAEDSRYPLLQNLVHAYFHQDYDLVGTSDDVLREYVGYTTPAERQDLIREIQDFLARHNASEEELSSSFDRILTPEIRFDIEESKPLEEVLHRFIQLLSV